MILIVLQPELPTTTTQKKTLLQCVRNDTVNGQNEQKKINQ